MKDKIMLKVFVIEFYTPMPEQKKFRSRVAANDRDEALDVLREEYGLAAQGEGNPFTLVRETEFQYEGSPMEIDTEEIKSIDVTPTALKLSEGIEAVIRHMSDTIATEPDDRNLVYHLAMNMKRLREVLDANGKTPNNLLGKHLANEGNEIIVVQQSVSGEDVAWLDWANEELCTGKAIDLKIMGLIP